LAIIAGMTTDVTGLSRAAARLTASRCPAASCRHRPLTGRHSLGPPHLGTRIVKSRRHVVAAGDPGATEIAGPMTPGERCRA